MEKVLVTGAEGILGYHTIKLLNEHNIRPRGLVDEGIDPAKFGLGNLEVDIIQGSVTDLEVFKKACEGIDTIFHMKFQLSLGGEEAEKLMEQINVGGTRNLLKAATEAGTKRIVYSSSSLAIGLNREPKPLDEQADWTKHQFNLPYALSRRNAEQEALAAKAGPDLPTVVVISPSFTMGPEDYIGAPANTLAQLISRERNVFFTVPIGFGILDVRDYADGAIRAAEKGRHGQRYILSGENVKPEQLIEKITTIAGVKPPSWLIPFPLWVVAPIIFVLNLLNKLRSQPPVPFSLLELWNRHAWYSTKLAQEELGWHPRPLEESIKDSLDWFSQQEKP